MRREYSNSEIRSISFLLLWVWVWNMINFLHACIPHVDLTHGILKNKTNSLLSLAIIHQKSNYLLFSGQTQLLTVSLGLLKYRNIFPKRTHQHLRAWPFLTFVSHPWIVGLLSSLERSSFAAFRLWTFWRISKYQKWRSSFRWKIGVYGGKKLYTSTIISPVKFWSSLP